MLPLKIDDAELGMPYFKVGMDTQGLSMGSKRHT